MGVQHTRLFRLSKDCWHSLDELKGLEELVKAVN